MRCFKEHSPRQLCLAGTDRARCAVMCPLIKGFPAAVMDFTAAVKYALLI